MIMAPPVLPNTPGWLPAHRASSFSLPWFALGFALGAANEYRNYRAYTDVVGPGATYRGFEIFEGQYRQVKRANPRKNTRLAALAALIMVPCVVVVFGTQAMPAEGIAAWAGLIALAVVIVFTRHRRPTNAQMAPVIEWHRQGGPGDPPVIRPWA